MSSLNVHLDVSGAALQGWQGVHTIPREVTYDEDSATLLFYPIEEVSLLRNDTLYSGTANLTFSPPSVNVSGTFRTSLSSLSSSAPCIVIDLTALLRCRALLGCTRGGYGGGESSLCQHFFWITASQMMLNN